MAKIKPITVSFKNNDEDKKLFEWISSKSNFSGFIKDILKEKMEEEINPGAKKVTTENKNTNLLDLSEYGDF